MIAENNAVKAKISESANIHLFGNTDGSLSVVFSASDIDLSSGGYESLNVGQLHAGRVTSVTLSGSYFATGGLDGTIRFMHTAQLLQFLVRNGTKEHAKRNRDDATMNIHAATINGHSLPISALVFVGAPKSSELCSAPNRLLSVSLDGTLGVHVLQGGGKGAGKPTAVPTAESLYVPVGFPLTCVSELNCTLPASFPPRGHTGELGNVIFVGGSGVSRVDFAAPARSRGELPQGPPIIQVLQWGDERVSHLGPSLVVTQLVTEAGEWDGEKELVLVAKVRQLSNTKAEVKFEICWPLCELDNCITLHRELPIGVVRAAATTECPLFQEDNKFSGVKSARVQKKNKMDIPCSLEQLCGIGSKSFETQKESLFDSLLFDNTKVEQSKISSVFDDVSLLYANTTLSSKIDAATAVGELGDDKDGTKLRLEVGAAKGKLAEIEEKCAKLYMQLLEAKKKKQ